MEVDLSNDVLGAVLRSQRMREICYDRADMGAMLYAARVSKRSGRLAKSAHARTEIGGVRNDRWIGVVIVGEPLIYDPAHEFGYHARGRGPGKGKEGPRELGKFIPGYHDLDAVLEMLESF